jgi:predicted GNAT family acetyltransferase
MGRRAEIVTVMDFQFEETLKGGRYFMIMPNGEEARLTYVKAGPRHIIADHTFVPVPYRGEGVAEALVERLVADARATGNRITPTCAGSSPTNSSATTRRGTTC